MGFVDGAHTTDTDTHADQTEIEGLGFRDRGTHRRHKTILKQK